MAARTLPPPVPRERELYAARALLAALNAEGVRYCHWKSNEHLHAGLRGETDLDLLVDRAQRSPAEALLARCGYKRFDAAALMRYPAVEDYVAMDAEAGRLVHCHLHYRLIAGEEHLKGHRLPWEDEFLASRRWCEDAGAFVADPDLEALTLVLRRALKLRLRDLASRVGGRRALRGGAMAEWAWLLERADAARSRELCATLLGERAADVYAELVGSGVTWRGLRRFRRAARPALECCRTFGPVLGRVLRWAREGAWLLAGANRRLLRSTYPLRRRVPHGGVTIAFVGSDGSGKSTAARELATLLATKVDVLLVYFGSGDGPSSALRWPLKVARNAAVRVVRRHGRPGAAAPGGERRPRGRLESAARVVWALALAREKRQRLRAACRARDRGVVVITDRYPQSQVPGFNDGPLLAHLVAHPNPLLRRLARYEAAPYRLAERHPPDVVVKLCVSPGVALHRKRETGAREVERRVSAVLALQYPRSAVVEVDADRPMADVGRAVREAVWSHI